MDHENKVRWALTPAYPATDKTPPNAFSENNVWTTVKTKKSKKVDLLSGALPGSYPGVKGKKSASLSGDEGKNNSPMPPPGGPGPSNDPPPSEGNHLIKRLNGLPYNTASKAFRSRLKKIVSGRTLNPFDVLVEDTDEDDEDDGIRTPASSDGTYHNPCFSQTLANGCHQASEDLLRESEAEGGVTRDCEGVSGKDLSSVVVHHLYELTDHISGRHISPTI